MTQREVIDVLELTPVPEVVELKEAFELRKDRPAIWLQRLCLWVLRKLGCFACTESVRIERHDIGRTGEKFMERLWARREAMWGSFTRGLTPEPKRLLIGAKDYQEMMGEVCTNRFTFDANYYMGRDGKPEVMGLKVEVVPHMRGMLLL
jgi:hypothetical protein